MNLNSAGITKFFSNIGTLKIIYFDTVKQLLKTTSECCISSLNCTNLHDPKFSFAKNLQGKNPKKRRKGKKENSTVKNAETTHFLMMQC